MMTMKGGWHVYKVLPTRIHMANQEADTMKINLKVRPANISFNCPHTSVRWVCSHDDKYDSKHVWGEMKDKDNEKDKDSANISTTTIKTWESPTKYTSNQNLALHTIKYSCHQKYPNLPAFAND